ncbi:MAG: PAS domain S-box protein, partial [Chloroflexi bacterium]|nr:PAS domain S-box protein [Chloroflexota bacterium]
MAGKSEGNKGPKKAAAGKKDYGLLGKSGFIAAAIIDGMPDGVVLVDMSGKIIYVNKAFERMLGYQADKLTGASALELPTYRKSKDRVKAREYLMRMVEKGGSEHIDMSAVTSDGRE